MRTEVQPLLVHTFGGRRFEGHSLDVTVLSELIAYRELVVECAKSLWRRGHPDRERLPSNYEDSIVLTFSRIEGGSVAVPIDRVRGLAEQAGFWAEPDEVDEAVVLIADAIAAAADGRPLPERFPKAGLEAFEGYGRTLREDEWFELKPAKRDAAVRYTSVTRGRLTGWAVERYEDSIDVVGTVTMAKVLPPRFAVRCDSEGPGIEAPFEPSAEAAVLEALTNHRSARARVRGRGVFGASGRLLRITRVDDVELIEGADRPLTPGARPIWSAIREIMADVRDEELAAIPPSADVDAVVYGGSAANP